MTPTPTVTPTLPSHYEQLIINPSFETDDGWTILRTEYPAGYHWGFARTGSRSMRLGIDTGYNVYSYSSVEQTIDMPIGLAAAELSFHYFSLGSWLDDDRIYFCVLRPSDDGILDCQFWTEPRQMWHRKSTSLLAYAGQSVKLRFGVKNDGIGGISAVYLDDVELRVW